MNTIFLCVQKEPLNFIEKDVLKVPLETLIIYYIYRTCMPEDISLKLVYVKDINSSLFTLPVKEENLNFVSLEELPWQVSSCLLPVVIYDDTVITGLCSVARHISKHQNHPVCSFEHKEGLLGFHKNCLQAPKETSVWTKFCEVDLINSVKIINKCNVLDSIPIDLVRFENHLNKPVKIHNVYKIARNMKKESMQFHETDTESHNQEKLTNQRIAKNRKWKSNIKKEMEIDCSTKIEDLGLVHQFAEGPFLTLADLILYPCYYIIYNRISYDVMKSILPSTSKWFLFIQKIQDLQQFHCILENLTIDKKIEINNIQLPETKDVSLYKCDPKRHNPKKKLFTRAEDIEAALNAIKEDMEFCITENNLKIDTINWENVPDGANPSAGHLPDERMTRKTQQLENLTLAVLNIAKDGDLIVDFCSGSGHLGILIAHFLPKCTIILLENKEQSLLRARKRVHEMNLKNVYLFQCNLDFFIGKFDIGIALHACGVASDLVLDKCLEAKAKFVLCPCCYGSLHITDKVNYPRSCRFSIINSEKYLCIGHAADQTHENHPLTARGARCMSVIDSDRARLAEEFGYKVVLSKLKPLSCTPKNNLLLGVPNL